MLCGLGIVDWFPLDSGEEFSKFPEVGDLLSEESDHVHDPFELREVGGDEDVLGIKESGLVDTAELLWFPSVEGLLLELDAEVTEGRELQLMDIRGKRVEDGADSVQVEKITDQGGVGMPLSCGLGSENVGGGETVVVLVNLFGALQDLCILVDEVSLLQDIASLAVLLLLQQVLLQLERLQFILELHFVVILHRSEQDVVVCGGVVSDVLLLSSQSG